MDGVDGSVDNGEKSSGIREVCFEQVVRAIAGDGEPTIIDEA